MPPRIHGHNLLSVIPLVKWSNIHRRLGICEVRPGGLDVSERLYYIGFLQAFSHVVSVQLVAGKGESEVGGI